ncbi:RluA family pseudouridine synthase [Salisediminibacterium selenitireducens]|uniref:Pseudouridine synthase n=1 Tax=Bacillus selenitireducens (strain ATCC 700615 / DSM 15326 / MLS10) TaxID=439292 RepID=D6XTP1_BACIE|nr:RluA family pseudouridine synthase [Salisediminibacterium selenitireducens]ADH99177.1 pseudouridine synthase, RluA family [[Bacillus] selenitireducens MLS10]
MNTFEFTVDEQGKRLDKWLTDQSDDWSRSLTQSWIQEGYVTVNDETSKANYKLKIGDVVRVKVPEVEELEITAEDLDLDIVYEDQDVIVVNKPAGMVVHPAPGHPSGTLVNGLMYHCQDLSGINGVARPGIVHRIDKDTSGLLMVAKHDKAHESLVDQLKNKTTIRQYEALVVGTIPHEKGTVDAPIGRDPQDRQKMTVTEENARDAVTHFQVIERMNGYTHVLCELETGRTHQIRVHMKYIGYPIVGDPKYGPRKKHDFSIEGQALHARTLGFVHPVTGEQMTFEAEVPERFKETLDQMKREFPLT